MSNKLLSITDTKAHFSTLENHILRVSRELVKLYYYDFPTHVMAPGSHLVVKPPPVGLEFDISATEDLICTD
jgi:hypothetical protein